MTALPDWTLGRVRVTHGQAAPATAADEAVASHLRALRYARQAPVGLLRPATSLRREQEHARRELQASAAADRAELAGDVTVKPGPVGLLTALEVERAVAMQDEQWARPAMLPAGLRVELYAEAIVRWKQARERYDLARARPVGSAGPLGWNPGAWDEVREQRAALDRAEAELVRLASVWSESNPDAPAGADDVAADGRLRALQAAGA